MSASTHPFFCHLRDLASCVRQDARAAQEAAKNVAAAASSGTCQGPSDESDAARTLMGVCCATAPATLRMWPGASVGSMHACPRSGAVVANVCVGMRSRAGYGEAGEPDVRVCAPLTWVPVLACVSWL